MPWFQDHPTNPGTIAKGSGCQTAGQESRSGVLHFSIPRQQEGWELETHHQLEGPQQVRGLPRLQDGDYQICHPSDQTWGVGILDRPEGCIPSRTDPSKPSEVPQVCDRDGGLPMDCLTIRPNLRPQSIYKDDLCSYVLGFPAGYISPRLHRRYTHQSEMSDFSTSRAQNFTGNSVAPRFHHQPGEVRTCPLPVFQLPGSDLQHIQGNGVSHAGQANINQVEYSTNMLPYSPLCSTAGKLDRNSGRFNRPSAFSKAQAPSHTPLATSPLGSGTSVPGMPDWYQPRTEKLATLVDKREEFEEGNLSVSQATGSNIDHGCLCSWVGCPPAVQIQDPPNLRILDGTLVGATHQHPRDAIRISSLAPLAEPPIRSFSTTNDGQLNSGSVLTQPRRYRITSAKSDGGNSPGELLSKQHRPPGETHSRETECTGRRIVPERHGAEHRVATQSRDCPAPTKRKSKSSDGGPLRNANEPPTSAICLPVSGQSSSSLRRTFLGLEQQSAVRIPTNSDHDSGSKPSHVVSKRGVTTNSPSLAHDKLVRSTPKATHRPSCETATQKRSHPTERSDQPRNHPAPQPVTVPPSRMEVKLRELRTAGFSEEVASFIAKPCRDTTLAVYEGKWKVWCSWCGGKQIDPINPTVPQLTNFFFFLFQEKKLAVSTIKGYRTAIGRTLPLSISTVESQYITDFLRSISLQRPPVSSRIPGWDLAVVLDYLANEFEPLRSLNLEKLTLKTIFLLTLASGRRRSEIHAIGYGDDHIRWIPGKREYKLYCLPEFLPKNQRLAEAVTPMHIPSLSNLVGRGGDDMVNCPCRSLRQYIDVTKDPRLRRNRQRLFIPFAVGAKRGSLKPATLSGWVVRVITNAYKAHDTARLRSGNIRAHDVRAIATSLSLYAETPLHHILDAAYWSSQRSFCDYYLKDMTGHLDGIFKMGPVVAAQRILHHPGGRHDE